MLQRLSDDIRECYLHADECRRHADETADPSRKQLLYLDMERRWLLLARSRAFAEQLSSFVKAARPSKP
jgi:hypothetical protein